MTNFSKLSILIFSIFFVTTNKTLGQDSLAVLTDSWLNLKTQLQRKADIVINLTSIISKSEKADKALIEKIRSTAKDLRQFIDSSKTLDSLTVRLTYEKDNNLRQAVSKTLAALIDDAKFKSQEESKNLQIQLMGVENRMASAKSNYNSICIKYKRTDLIYEKLK